MSNIVDIQLEKVQERLLKKNIKLDISSAVKEYFVKKGYDPVYGACLPKRVIWTRFLTNLHKK